MHRNIHLHIHTGPLVTQCAKGVESACDKLAQDPAAISALKNIDTTNPTGYAASHARAPSAYAPSVPVATQQMVRIVSVCLSVAV
jgi:hypothetical protein